jgi:hypothetical protein
MGGDGNMKESTKIIAFGITVLLISSALFPSIYASTSKMQPLKVEIDDINGSKQMNITVPETSVQTIQQLFAEFNSRLNRATTEQEQKLIVHNTVKQLHDLGVLGNLTIEQAQRLILRWYKPYSPRYSEKLNAYLIKRNMFCLVSGRTNFTYSFHRISNWLEYGGEALFMTGAEIGAILYLTEPSLDSILLLLLPFWIILTLGPALLGQALAIRADVNKLALLDEICIGYDYGENSPIYYAQGWMNTQGLLGNKTWNGELLGNLPGLKFQDEYADFYYPAVWGFSGIKIWLNEDGTEKSYLGSAILVGLDQKTL